MDLVNLFKELLKRESITPNDGGILDFIKEYLPDFKSIRIDSNGVKNLFLYKEFSKGIHLNFAGHIDVVPSGKGWDTDPFDPIVKDGFIYARGSQDMKSGVCAFVSALKEIKTFNGTLSIMLTSDEEGEAKYGTNEILKYLKAKDILPKYSVLAEPTSSDIIGDAVKIGRRGSINGTLILKGLQGHTAYPAKAKNPVHQIANILPKLAGYDLDDGDDFFEPSKIVIVDIRGGIEVSNVTPADLKIMFNLRNNTKTNQETIKEHIAKLFEGLDYSLSLSSTAKAFMTSADSLIVSKLKNSIKEVSKIEAKNSTAGGTSDARYISSYGVDVVEFGVRNDTIHAPNERCSLKELQILKEVFTHLIKSF